MICLILAQVFFDELFLPLHTGKFTLSFKPGRIIISFLHKNTEILFLKNSRLFFFVKFYRRCFWFYHVFTFLLLRLIYTQKDLSSLLDWAIILLSHCPFHFRINPSSLSGDLNLETNVREWYENRKDTLKVGLYIY